ncbi:hypothetical protein ACTFIY_001753 [Dictyostelium cf. discoideum]
MKLLIIETKSELLYFNYLLEYDDLIDGVVDSDSLVYQYTMTVFSVKGLQYLLKNYNSIHCNFFENLPLIYYEKSSEYILRNQNRLIEFLRFYCSKKFLITSKLIKDWKSLTQFIIMNCDLNVTNCREMNDFKRYQWYIDNVLSAKLEKPTDSTYFNRILDKVKTEQDIDYILKNYNFYRYTFAALQFYSFLDQLDLSIYFESKAIQLNLKDLLFDRNKIYFQSFINSLSIGDLETLKKISLLNLKFNFINTPIPITSSLIIKSSKLKKQQDKESSTFCYFYNELFLPKLENIESLIKSILFLTNENNYQILSNRGFNELVYNLFKRFPITTKTNLNLNFNYDPYGSLLFSINLIIKENNLIDSNFILNQLNINLFKGEGKDGDSDENIKFKFNNHELKYKNIPGCILKIDYYLFDCYAEGTSCYCEILKRVTDGKLIRQIYSYSVDQAYSFIELILGYYILSKLNFFNGKLSEIPSTAMFCTILNETEFPFQLIQTSNYKNLLSNLIYHYFSLSLESQSSLKLTKDFLFLLIFGEIDLLFELFSMIKLKFSNNFNEIRKIFDFDFKIINYCFQYLNFENCIKLIKFNIFPIELITRCIFETGKFNLLEFLLSEITTKTLGYQALSSSNELTTATQEFNLNDIINIYDLYYSFKFNNLKTINFIFNNFKNKLINYDFGELLYELILNRNFKLIEIIVNFCKSFKSKIPLKIARIHCLKSLDFCGYKILNYLFNQGINQNEIKIFLNRYKTQDYDYFIQNNYFKN